MTQRLTGVSHSVIRRVQRIGINRKGEEAPERAFTPLQVGVDVDQGARDNISGCRRNP